MNLPAEIKNITGIAEAKEGNVMFSSNDFSFTYMYDTITNSNSEPKYLWPKSGYVYGTTHKGLKIAAFIGDKPIQFFGQQRVNIGCFVVSTWDFVEKDINNYDSIEFSGGTLNNLFYRKSLNINESHSKKIDFDDDTISFAFKYKKECVKIDVFSEVVSRDGINGIGIETSDVKLRIVFEKQKHLGDFLFFYNRLISVFSFMTNRNNIDFDNINLQLKDTKLDFDFYNNVASVFLKIDDIGTKKPKINNICFEDIQDVLPKLFELFFEPDNSKNSFSFDFHPASDKEATIISNKTVCDICTSLECELSKLKSKRTDIYQELINKVTKDINDFKLKYSLTNEELSAITGSIEHWGDSLTEKIFNLYQDHIDEIKQLPPPVVHLDKDKISKFVKFRNAVTNGRYSIITQEVAEISYYMGALSYCAFLKRIGLSKEQIKNLCVHKIMK